MDSILMALQNLYQEMDRGVGIHNPDLFEWLLAPGDMMAVMAGTTAPSPALILDFQSADGVTRLFGIPVVSDTAEKTTLRTKPMSYCVPEKDSDGRYTGRVHTEQHVAITLTLA